MSRIRDMQKILNMYRFTRMVEKATYKKERKLKEDFELTGFRVWHPSSQSMKKKFHRWHPWITKPHIQRICADSIKEGYLTGSTDDISGLSVDRVCVTDKGRDLTDKAFFIIPIGLIEALWAKHGQVIAGVFIGILVPMALALGKWLWSVIMEIYGR